MTAAFATDPPGGTPQSVASTLAVDRILVVMTHGGLGDLLVTTPALAALRAAAPHAQLDILCQSAFAPVLEGNPHISRVVPWNPPASAWARFGEEVALVKQGRYDLGIVLWSTAREAWLLWAAGVPRRVGQARRLLYSFLYTDQVAVRSEAGDTTSHWVDVQFDYLRALGITAEPGPLVYAVPPRDQETADQLLAEAGAVSPDAGGGERPLVALHIGKGIPLTEARWPVGHFARIADTLTSELRATVILTGSPSERSLVDATAALCQGPVVNLAGRTSLNELGGVLRRCRLMICPDSGPMHLAAALGVPVVALFPMRYDFPFRWRPWRVPHIVLRREPVPCPAGCRKETCARFVCVEQVSPEVVAAAAAELLGAAA